MIFELDDTVFSVSSLSSTAHVAGTFSAIFYGISSGYLTYADIFDYKYASKNSGFDILSDPAARRAFLRRYFLHLDIYNLWRNKSLC